MISREEYYPFGETSYGSYGKKRYRFCGKEKDEESGLYYYGMRYYSPWTCRFMSVDPLAPKYPFYTPYQYAGNKPINNIDLDGGEDKPAPKTDGKGGQGNNTGLSDGTFNLNIRSNGLPAKKDSKGNSSIDTKKMKEIKSPSTTGTGLKIGLKTENIDTTSFFQGMNKASESLTNDFRTFINTVNSPKGPEHLFNTATRSVLGSFEWTLGALGTLAGVSPEDNSFVAKTNSDINNAVNFVLNAPNMTKEQMGETTTYGLVAVGSILATRKLMGPSSSASSTASTGSSVGLRTGNITSIGEVNPGNLGSIINQHGVPSYGATLDFLPSDALLRELTVIHDTEFAVMYNIGNKGVYRLYQGTKTDITLPYGPTDILLKHTHPGGTAKPSGWDIRWLEKAQAAGSPQVKSVILPIGKARISFNVNTPHSGF